MVFRALVVMSMLVAAAWPAQAEMRAYDRIVAATPFFADGKADRDPDRVVLDSGDGTCDFDLYIYLAHPAPRPRAPDVYKKTVLSGGGACGAPALRLGPKGAIMIDLVNDFHPQFWRKTLTIAYRAGRFVVAGYSERTSSITGPENADKPETFTTCDVNLLTGKGVKNGKPFALALPTVTLADWSGDLVETKLCVD